MSNTSSKLHKMLVLVLNSTSRSAHLGLTNRPQTIYFTQTSLTIKVTSQTIVALLHIFNKTHARAENKQTKENTQKLTRNRPRASLFRARACYFVSHCSRWYNDFNTSEPKEKLNKNYFTHHESPSDYNKAAVPAIKSPSQALQALIP